MIDPWTLGLFTVAALGVLVSPGPAVVYVVTRSVTQGAPAGVASQVGLCSGLLVHVAAVASGVSATLMRWPWSLDLLRFLGAGYLIWMAVGTWRGRLREQETGNSSARSVRRLVWDGFVIDTLNPKPALFMLAFLPQFVDASAGSVVAQLVSLGLFFVVLAFVTGAAYALLAGRLSGLFRRRGERIVRAVSASVLLGMAAAVLILK